MPCFHPIVCWKPSEGGAILFSEKKNCREIKIPCGQCIGCRVDRGQAWAIRIMHERKMHPASCFLTLTYSDEHCPTSLNYVDFQKFIRALRKKLDAPIRFYMCGEYGGLTGRPHYHAAIFNTDFGFDRVRVNSVHGRNPLYKSKVLESAWPFGFHAIGDLTMQSARYVASYCVKKVVGERAAEHYKAVDIRTGEIIDRMPEFSRMSLKPGIGWSYFQKYGQDIMNWDSVVIDGKEQYVPAYYHTLMRSLNPARYDEILYERYLSANPAECTRERLAVREVVAKAKYNFYHKEVL